MSITTLKQLKSNRIFSLLLFAQEKFDIADERIGEVTRSYGHLVGFFILWAGLEKSTKTVVLSKLIEIIQPLFDDQSVLDAITRDALDNLVGTSIKPAEIDWSKLFNFLKFDTFDASDLEKEPFVGGKSAFTTNLEDILSGQKKNDNIAFKCSIHVNDLSKFINDLEKNCPTLAETIERNPDIFHLEKSHDPCEILISTYFEENVLWLEPFSTLSGALPRKDSRSSSFFKRFFSDSRDTVGETNPPGWSLVKPLSSVLSNKAPFILSPALQSLIAKQPVGTLQQLGSIKIHKYTDEDQVRLFIPRSSYSVKKECEVNAGIFDSFLGVSNIYGSGILSSIRTQLYSEGEFDETGACIIQKQATKFEWIGCHSGQPYIARTGVDIEINEGLNVRFNSVGVVVTFPTPSRVTPLQGLMLPAFDKRNVDLNQIWVSLKTQMPRRLIDLLPLPGRAMRPELNPVEPPVLGVERAAVRPS